MKFEQRKCRLNLIAATVVFCQYRFENICGFIDLSVFNLAVTFILVDLVWSKNQSENLSFFHKGHVLIRDML